MKKEKYICPQVKTYETETEPLLDGSVTGDNGVGWGGVDETGNQVPDANNLNVWEEDSDWPKTHTDLFEE